MDGDRSVVQVAGQHASVRGCGALVGGGGELGMDVHVAGLQSRLEVGEDGLVVMLDAGVGVPCGCRNVFTESPL